MTRCLIMNVLLAVLWLLLLSGGLVDFGVGMIIGFILLFLFRPILDSAEYTRRVLAVLAFIGVFLREFVASNWSLARAVVFRRDESLHPNFIQFDVSGMQPWEILLLSHCITLTPGTTTVDLVDNGRTLVVHAFDADDPEAVRHGIENTLKSAILRFSR